MPYEKGEKSNKENEVRCLGCGKRFKGNDKTKCPYCGSTKKADGPIHFDREAKVEIGFSVSGGAVHETHMSPQSWTIFALILGLVIPPTFYAVFSILPICFWYKLLIWLGIILIAFFLTRSYTTIKFLRFIADKAYGKRKI